MLYMEHHARVKVTVAAKQLGVNPWTLRRWIYAGKVPHIKTETGRVFVSTAWLESQVNIPDTATETCPTCGRPWKEQP